MVINEGILRDFLRLFVWFPLRWVILVLPVSWGIFLLRTMGDINYYFSKGKKKALMDNLLLIKGAADEKTVREYFRNHYIDRLLIFIFPKLGLKEVERFIEFTGIENLDEALKEGKGVILVHGHFGPVHIPLVALSRLGYKMKQIGLPSDEGLSWIGRNVAFRLRIKYESQMPAEIIKADSFLKGAFKWLNNNGIIMITGDGSGTPNRRGRHKVFKFFNKPVLFPLGPAILAQKTNAKILPMFMLPGEKKTYKIIIEKPLTSGRETNEIANDITDQFVKRLEIYVSKYPGYMHFLDTFYPGGLIEQKA